VRNNVTLDGQIPVKFTHLDYHRDLGTNLKQLVGIIFNIYKEFFLTFNWMSTQR
ncbi:unnamed protein product, partial [Allacma fusca]